MAPRFPVSPDQIDQVVTRFYAAVRRHEILGPIFATHVTDWPEHERKIAAFWARAILGQYGYDGNPMAAHRAAGNVRTQHFPVWLGLFDKTLHATLPEDAAEAWSFLAHRIGNGLSMGVAMDEAEAAGGPPRLRH